MLPDKKPTLAQRARRAERRALGLYQRLMDALYYMQLGHAMTALLAGLAVGAAPLFTGSLRGTSSRLQTRDEAERETSKWLDDKDAIRSAEEKRQRKNAKRLRDMRPNAIVDGREQRSCEASLSNDGFGGNAGPEKGKQ